MAEHYDEAMVEITAEIAASSHYATDSFDTEAKAILDAVAPLIAAKAQASILRKVGLENGSISDIGLYRIADDIERTTK